MTLEAILTFIGILVAILAMARPVQRRSIETFVPRWPMGFAVLGATICLGLRDLPLGWNPFGLEIREIPTLLKLLDFASFVILVAALICSWRRWDKAKLTAGNREKVVDDIFRAALREDQFDELERVVRRNRDSLTELPSEAITVLFSPRVVGALANSDSMLHLELLSDMGFLSQMEHGNRQEAVDTTLRELLVARSSAIRAFVVARFGGMEGLNYNSADQSLIERTISKPKWYVEANAHYPLMMVGLEHLRAGTCDVQYNAAGDHYYAPQGFSTRARCPIYLGFKTHVLAIEAAIKLQTDDDLYVSDLSQLFQEILARSKFDEAIWNSSTASREHPTPYAYLLDQILTDLGALSREVVRKAITNPKVTPSNTIARGLATAWGQCTANIAGSENVSPEFRTKIIRRHLEFILGLKTQPSDLSQELINGREDWAELYVPPINILPSNSDSFLRAIDSLDQGKPHIAQGIPWLRTKLERK